MQIAGVRHVRRRKNPPKICLHKGSGQAVVRLDGRDIYLGVFGTQASLDLYDQKIAEWLAGGRKLPRPEIQPTTVEEVKTELVKDIILAYLEKSATYYRGPDGKPTPEYKNMLDALAPVRKLYGNLPAVEFGPLALQAVQEDMIRSGLARTTINARIHRIRRCFRWAVKAEKITGDQIYRLESVDSLKAGRSEARESDKIEPVPREIVLKTLPKLNRVVAAMVRVQLLTGCRAGEVMVLRGCDLFPGERGLEYRPPFHKTSWRGKTRVIPLGPKAQAILKEFAKSDPQAYLFDPLDVQADVEARRTGKRKRKPNRSHRYDRRAYRQAVVRACDRAFPHPIISKIPPSKRTAEQRQELKVWRKEHRWSPLQLRHTRATEVRAAYGLEGSQVLLGHAKADTTEIYAAKNLELARKIADEIG
jgi:integrase